MRTNEDSRHIEHNGQFGEQNTDPDMYIAYGIDRYAYNQGYDAKYDFTILENTEPTLVARGGQRTVTEKEQEKGHWSARTEH